MSEQVFRHDTRAERSVGTLRLIAAVAVAGATIWAAFLQPGGLCWLGIVASWLAVIGWIVAWRASRRRAASTGAHYLALREAGLALAEGGPEIVIPWSEVTSVDVDEEKLVVRIARRDAAPLPIEPRYQGASVYTLRDAIDAARQRYNRS